MARTTSSKKNLEFPDGLNGSDMLDMYNTMVLSRKLDERVWLLNRQGKAAIAASAQGHEAAQIASVRAMDLDIDHFLIYYRQFCVMLGIGTSPTELLSGFMAKDGDPMSGARQFPLHGAHPRVDLFSFSNVVGTQLPQAAGVALADKLRGEKSVTIVYFGDGAASQGDTHEAMNFAGIHKLPIVFFCENNRYAISVPLSKQMAVENIATRAEGYGFEGITVDGTDILSVYEVTKLAVDKARSGGGPTLIETMVERLLPHTTDDDHSKYRSTNDIERMMKRDPIEITRNLLMHHGILSKEADIKIQQSAVNAVNSATDKVELMSYPDAEYMFSNLFDEQQDN